jgi:hypothetical protein
MFQPAVNYPASAFTDFVIAGDFTGDGHLDLLAGGDLVNQFAFLKGNGDGTFQTTHTFSLPYAAAEAAAGDFNGDGHLDLAVTDFFDPAGSLAVLFGRGDGTFAGPVYYGVGSQPLGIIATDFGNGQLDLAVADAGSNDVSVLLGRGDGTFAPAVRYPVGVAPDSLVAADVNGDGKLDLGVTNGGSTYVSLLPGRGDGTFAPEQESAVTDPPTPHRGLAAADFNGDGRLDLATPELLTSNDISILLGNGDGTFQTPMHFAVGLGPVAMVSGDFTGDGRRDIASVNPTTNTVSVALGAGDGTLQAPVSYPVGDTPQALATGDFNGDGRLDLAIANFASGDISILLGLGDGTFRPEQRYPVGQQPTSIVAGDFNGDGLIDLAVADTGSDGVSLLFGRGDGTFLPEARIAAPGLPQALVAGDFNRDGRTDLAVADYRSHDVAVFLGRSDGTFEAPARFVLGTSPIALITGDFNGDGVLDLATANLRANDVAILLGRGNGSFQPAARYDAGSNPLALTAGDFNRNGRVDLAVADSTGNAVALLAGRGDGTFAPPVQRPVPAYPRALLADDFNNDGRTDLVLATQFAADVSVLQGLGDGAFVSPETITNEIRSTPLVADLNGDGTPDVAVINHGGQVLLRYGRPDALGSFDPPIVLNPDPRFAVRELAMVQTERGQQLAALDLRDSALAFYTPQPNGSFSRTAGPTIPGILPVHLAAGDLNGDALGDLVVAAAGTNQVFVYLQHQGGNFGPTPDYQSGVGTDPSAIRLADVDGDGRLDIVVTNQFSGDVSVLLNNPARPFCTETRFRVGVGLYWLDQAGGELRMRSFQASAGAVSGIFEEGQPAALAVTNSGANSFSLLQGTGTGGFRNPQPARTFATGVRPTSIVAGDFNGDRHLDLAILNEGSEDISIFLGDGLGSFTATQRFGAGNNPTGLALADVNGDGLPDLLVGNQFGDVLALLGRSDGTFLPYQRTDRHVALAVADLNGDGRQDLIFADAARDSVTVQYAQPGQSFVQDRGNGLLAPGAVTAADLDGDGIPDLVVANSGSNNALVYLGLGNGQFAPARSFFAGTNPAGVTVADLNRDGIPDLVAANEGSNDVSILFGQGTGAAWTLVPGPRLKAGAGPVSTTVADLTGNGIPDILVANSQSNTISLLRGVGNGFFNDQNPQTFPTGIDPRQVLVGDFTGDGTLDLVSVNALSNDLTFFADFGSAALGHTALAHTIASGGDDPVAAVSGDFARDGKLELLVANNGNGRETLFRGTSDSLVLVQTLTPEDMPHPTALVLAPDGLGAYVAGEQGSALLLTAFAVPAAFVHAPADHPPLTSLLLINGPGYLTAVDIVELLTPRPPSIIRPIAADANVPEAASATYAESDFGIVANEATAPPPAHGLDESARHSLRLELEDLRRPGRADVLPANPAPSADPGQRELQDQPGTAPAVPDPVPPDDPLPADTIGRAVAEQPTGREAGEHDVPGLVVPRPAEGAGDNLAPARLLALCWAWRPWLRSAPARSGKGRNTSSRVKRALL